MKLSTWFDVGNKILFTDQYGGEQWLIVAQIIVGRGNAISYCSSYSSDPQTLTTVTQNYLIERNAKAEMKPGTIGVKMEYDPFTLEALNYSKKVSFYFLFTNGDFEYAAAQKIESHDATHAQYVARKLAERKGLIDAEQVTFEQYNNIINIAKTQNNAQFN